MEPMILLGFLIVLVFLFLAYTANGMANIGVAFDLPAFCCVLILTAGYILVCGTKRFLAGLPAILRRPAESRTDVADYYWRLATYTLACGAALAITLSCLSVYPLGDQELCKQMLVTAIFLFCYSSWLSLLFFVPIVSHFSEGDASSKLMRSLAGPAVVGVCLLSPVFTGMCINWVGVQPIEVLRQNFWCFDVWFFWDFASFIVMLATITAFRLGMGRLPNRFVWIPICIIVGVQWSLQGMTIIFADWNPQTFYTGFQVALLTTLYGFICTLAVIVNRAWFFTTLGAVLAICALAFQGVPNVPEIFVVRFILVLYLIAMFCALGRFCDMFYLAVTRYESFSGLFRKHKIEWIIFGVLVICSVIAAFLFIE